MESQMSERYNKALEMANDYLGEDDGDGSDTSNNANASQIASLNQQKTNLVNQKNQLNDKIKQLNKQIAKIDGQLANLGSGI